MSDESETIGILQKRIVELESEFTGLAEQARISSEREQVAWRERDEALKEMLEARKNLTDAVRLLAYFAARAP